MSRQEAREAQAHAAETQAELFLERDPSKAMAWIQEAARLRGGIQNESAKHYHRHWLMAREAWEKGVGWVVAQHDMEVMSVAFSPPGSCERCWPQVKLLASAGKDGAVRLIDLSRGGETQLLGQHERRAIAVAFSPDGRLLASAGTDSTVRVWEWEGERWEQVRVLRPRQGEAEFNLLTFDGTVRLWPLPPTDRAEFEEWLTARSPWRVEEGELVPNDYPGLTPEFLDAPAGR